MKHSEKTFQVLDALGREEISTQRQLADNSGISLGQVNYILKSLLEKGLVKISNFKKNPYKISYAYLLTPKGIEAKSKLAVKFVLRKLREYEALRTSLAERLKALESDKNKKLIFIGPSLVKEFIGNIIEDKKLNLILAAHIENVELLNEITRESFDIAILFDENLSTEEEVKHYLDLPEDRIVNLW